MPQGWAQASRKDQEASGRGHVGSLTPGEALETFTLARAASSHSDCW